MTATWGTAWTHRNKAGTGHKADAFLSSRLLAVVCRRMVFFIGVVKRVLRRSSLRDKGVTVTSMWKDSILVRHKVDFSICLMLGYCPYKP